MMLQSYSMKRRQKDMNGDYLVFIMHYVYLIKSIVFPEVVYVGYTTDVEQRLETHNSGGSIHTAKYRPWKLVMFLTFTEETKARDFERYLKSQTSRLFAKKHFW